MTRIAGVLVAHSGKMSGGWISHMPHPNPPAGIRGALAVILAAAEIQWQGILASRKIRFLQVTLTYLIRSVNHSSAHDHQITLPDKSLRTPFFVHRQGKASLRPCCDLCVGLQFLRGTPFNSWLAGEICRGGGISLGEGCTGEGFRR